MGSKIKRQEPWKIKEIKVGQKDGLISVRTAYGVPREVFKYIQEITC